MPNRRVRVHHPAVLGLLLSTAMVTQGCMAIAWLGVVGVDGARTSDIEFQPFENSWVIALPERQRLGLVKNMTVMPFAGDPMMAERWAVLFREMTDLRVVSSSDATRHRVFHHEKIGSAQQTDEESHADCVLDGNVIVQPPQKSFAGLKERSVKRLYLHLVCDSGALMWKTELPYTIVSGAKDLDEEVVLKALMTHVRAQANEREFSEPGAFNKRTISRSLHDVSDHQMARPLPGSDRP
jgi:hypothetical protein